MKAAALSGWESGVMIALFLFQISLGSVLTWGI